MREPIGVFEQAPTIISPDFTVGHGSGSVFQLRLPRDPVREERYIYNSIEVHNCYFLQKTVTAFINKRKQGNPSPLASSRPGTCEKSIRISWRRGDHQAQQNRVLQRCRVDTRAEETPTWSLGSWNIRIWKTSMESA